MNIVKHLALPAFLLLASAFAQLKTDGGRPAAPVNAEAAKAATQAPVKKDAVAPAPAVQATEKAANAAVANPATPMKVEVVSNAVPVAKEAAAARTNAATVAKPATPAKPAVVSNAASVAKEAAAPVRNDATAVAGQGPGVKNDSVSNASAAKSANGSSPVGPEARKSEGAASGESAPAPAPLTRARPVASAPASGFRGVPLVSLNFQFSAPLKLVPGTNATPAPSSYAFPYSIGLTAGYILEWNKAHQSMAMYSLSYEDDPVNNLFDANLQSKTATPSFTGQTLYQMLTLKHKIQVLPIVRVGVSGDLSISLSRNSVGETFDRGLYNSTDLALGGEVTVNKLGIGPQALQTLKLVGKLQAKQGWYPNYSDATGKGDALLNSLSGGGTGGSVKTNKEDVLRWIAGVEASSELLQGLNAFFSYEFELDPYAQKYLLDTKGAQTSKSETLSRNTLNAELFYTLRPKDLGRPLLSLGAKLLLDTRASDWLEQGIVSTNAIGSLPSSVTKDALTLSGGSVGLFFPGYKNEATLSVGPSLSFYFSPNVSTELGYTFSRKDYGGKYARYGAGELAGTASGTYKSEKVWQNYQTFSVGFKFRHSTGYRVFSPYFGYQVKDSNDRADLDGRYQIFFLGFKTSYEF